MSTYVSEHLEVDYPVFVDVAYDCFGRDVRVIINHESMYITSDEARDMSAALTRAANAIDKIERTP